MADVIERSIEYYGTEVYCGFNLTIPLGTNEYKGIKMSNTVASILNSENKEIGTSKFTASWIEKPIITIMNSGGSISSLLFNLVSINFVDLDILNEAYSKITGTVLFSLLNSKNQVFRTFELDLDITRKEKLRILSINPITIKSTDENYFLTPSNFNIISTNDKYDSIYYCLKEEGEYKELTDSGNSFLAGVEYNIKLLDETQHFTDPYTTVLLKNNYCPEVLWTSQNNDNITIENEKVIGLSQIAPIITSDRDCTVVLGAEQGGQLESQILKPGQTSSLMVNLLSMKRGQIDKYFVTITDSLETFGPFYFKYENVYDRISTYPQPELLYLRTTEEETDRLEGDVFGGFLYYKIKNIGPGTPYFIFNHNNQTYKIKGESGVSESYLSSLFKRKTGTIDLQIQLQDSNYTYQLGESNYRFNLIEYPVFDSGRVYNKNEIHLLKDDSDMEVLELRGAKKIFEDKCDDDTWKKYGILPEKTKLFIEINEARRLVETDAPVFSIDEDQKQYLIITFKKENSTMSKQLKDLFLNQNIDYNVKILVQLENIFGDLYYGLEASIPFIFREEIYTTAPLGVKGEGSLEKFGILQNGDSLWFNYSFYTYNTTPIKMQIELKRSDKLEDDDDEGYISYYNFTVTPKNIGPQIEAVYVSSLYVDEPKYLHFRLRYINPYTNEVKTLLPKSGVACDTVYRSLAIKRNFSYDVKYIKLEDEAISFELKNYPNPTDVIQVIGDLPSSEDGFKIEAKYDFIVSMDKEIFGTSKTLIPYEKNTYEPKEKNWYHSRISFKITISYGLKDEGLKTFSYAFSSAEIDNIIPTVSYRQNLLGINTRDIDKKDLTSETLMLIGEADNRNKIKFNSINGNYCKIEGFLLDCGTW